MASPAFHIVGNAAQAGATYNVTMLAQAQATHAAKIVARCLRDGIRTMDVRLRRSGIGLPC